MSSRSITRLKGEILWLDLVTGDNVDRGTTDRVILRSDSLAIDLILDIRVENNILTIRGERKFEKKVNEENYLRMERAYGSFSRSFSLANSVNSAEIKAEYQNGALTLHIPKREETKPKQIKVSVGTPAIAAAATKKAA